MTKPISLAAGDTFIAPLGSEINLLSIFGGAGGDSGAVFNVRAKARAAAVNEFVFLSEGDFTFMPPGCRLKRIESLDGAGVDGGDIYRVTSEPTPGQQVT